MRRREVTLAIIVALGAVLSAQAPPPPPPPPYERPAQPAAPRITVSGRVLDGQSNQPIANVRVGPPGNMLGISAVLTDAAGRFTMSAPARMALRVSKTGFGYRNIVALADAGDIALQRSSAIGGRVVDDNGDPVIGARVSLEPFPIPDRPGQFLLDVSTDDRGEYRLGGIAAGTYAVSLLVMSGQIMTVSAGPIGPGAQIIARSAPPARQFYPAGTDYRDAKGLTVGVGEEFTTADFVVRADDAAAQPFSATAAVGAASSLGSQALPGRGVVRGRVITPDGRPLPRAQVRLGGGRTVRQQSAWTDSSGRFEFRELPASSIIITASKVGYFPNIMREGGMMASTFQLAENEVREGFDVTLMPWSVIEGRVVDEHGEPMDGVAVQSLQVGYTGGRRALTGVGSARTNDRGEYRLYGVAPGPYIVSAAIGQVSTADVPGYARSYYPGTTDPAAAQYVTVGVGETARSIDIGLARVKTAKISGRMIDSHGMPTQGGSVQLVPTRASVLALSVGARIEPNGVFEFPNVPAGSYVIQVVRGLLNSFTEGEFAAMPVAVSEADVTDLTVQTSAGTRVTGRVIFNGSPNARPSPEVEIRAVPSDTDLAPSNQLATARMASDSGFEINGLNGPRRLQVLRTPKGWALESIRVNGVEVTDRPLAFGAGQLENVEIELTDRITSLQATVIDASSRPVADRVVVFSTDRSDWYPDSRFVRVSSATATEPAIFEGLPPGTYYVAALGALPQRESVAINGVPVNPAMWQDPSYLEAQAPRATTVTLRPASTTTARVRTAAR